MDLVEYLLGVRELIFFGLIQSRCVNDLLICGNFHKSLTSTRCSGVGDLKLFPFVTLILVPCLVLLVNFDSQHLLTGPSAFLLGITLIFFSYYSPFDRF